MPLGLASRARAAHPRRPRLLRGERGGLDRRLSRVAGEHRLSDALDRLRRQRRRRLVALRRGARRRSARRHRRHHRRRLPGGALVTRITFLPFTRPTIDEATIAGVAEVLRSRLDHVRAAGAGVRGALSACSAGARCARFTSGTAALEIALRARRHRPRRRGHHYRRMTWVATRERGRRASARARCSSTWTSTRATSTSPQSRPRSRRARGRSCRSHLAGLPVDLDALYAIADAARPARRRGRRAGHRLRAGAAARSAASATSSSFSFHANKNMTTTEGGALVAERRRRGRARSSGCASRASQLPGGRHGRRGAGRQVQPDRRRRAPSASGSSRSLERLHARAQRARAALFRSARRADLLGLRAAAARTTPAHELAHVPGRCCRLERARHARASASWTRCATAASASACTTRRMHLFSSTARLGFARGDVPARRAHRRAHGDAAALPGDARRATSTASASAVARCS